MAALACVLALPAGAAAGAPPWQVGAARIDTTPPLFTTARDQLEFPGSVFNAPAPPLPGPESTQPPSPGCPQARSFYDAVRHYALEEPYQDTDGSGEFNYADPNNPSSVGDQWCDANANGRWDGIYLSGGIASLARPQSSGDAAHDPIDARAVAFSDGQKKVVLASVVAQGLFENYTRQMRDQAKLLCPSIDDVIVSANHNESSPDTIGIYGAPDLAGAAGQHSGIDDYYMDFLVGKVAHAAAAAACDNLVPGTLRAEQFLLPPNLAVRLSNNFPTTNDNNTPAAIDPKVRVLQARDANGTPVFTMMNLAAHNQEIGHDADSHDISSDWPGAFHSKLEQLVPGMAMFLVGDNGSEEDPKTVPDADTSACAGNGECKVYTQSHATGEAFAQTVADHMPAAAPITPGAVSATRMEFDVPVENHIFQAAFAAGLFGKRQAIPCSTPSSGTCIHTEVSATQIGPDVQLLGNPGEAFPALIVGSPWGIDEASCPDSDTIDRSNPPVPNFHARSPFRFQIGLSDDMIGYMIPAWGYSEIPGVFTTNCTNDVNEDTDQRGHQHKLETEGVGPTASNLVAQNLSALLAVSPDPTAATRSGRYIYADGTLSRRPQRPVGAPTEDAVGLWLADPGASTLAPGTGTVIAKPGIGFFGARKVDATGEFMDYDGLGQSAPDITTRGMALPATGAITKRYYVDLYPVLSGGPLGAARSGGPPKCIDNVPPVSRPRDVSVQAHRLRISGTAHDVGCSPAVGELPRTAGLVKVKVSVALLAGGRCRYLHADGGLGKPARCASRTFLDAAGTRHWSLKVATELPPGHYRARVRGIDGDGNREPRNRINRVRFHVA